MAAEKRTVSSEIREFFTEIQDGFREWRLRAGRAPHRASRDAPPPAEIMSAELDEITFTPIDPEAPSTVTGKGKTAVAAAFADNICPITRQVIDPRKKAYQCRQCGIYYSPEGWEFLCQTAKSQCCGCHSVNTVFPVLRIG